MLASADSYVPRHSHNLIPNAFAFVFSHVLRKNVMEIDSIQSTMIDLEWLNIDIDDLGTYSSRHGEVETTRHSR